MFLCGDCRGLDIFRHIFSNRLLPRHALKIGFLKITEREMAKKRDLKCLTEVLGQNG